MLVKTTVRIIPVTLADRKMYDDSNRPTTKELTEMKTKPVKLLDSIVIG